MNRVPVGGRPGLTHEWPSRAQKGSGMLRQMTVFEGTPTTKEERDALRAAGWVHVTGLQVYDLGKNATEEPSYVIGEKITLDDCGKRNANNSKEVLVTPGGEVWIRAWSEGMNDLATPTEERLAPERGGFVPLSNGERVGSHELMARFANPDAGLAYRPSRRHCGW